MQLIGLFGKAIQQLIFNIKIFKLPFTFFRKNETVILFKNFQTYQYYDCLRSTWEIMKNLRFEKCVARWLYHVRMLRGNDIVSLTILFYSLGNAT